MTDLRTGSNGESASTPGRRQPLACLVLHGLGGGPYELEPLLEALRVDGNAVSVPVLPGHEGPGPRMPASQWTDWAAAADRAFDELAARGAPVAVIGFSTGATVGLHLAASKPVVRQVFLAPFMAIRYTPMIPLHPATYLRPLSRLWPDLPRRSPAVRDREMRRRAVASARFRTFNVPAAVSALELIDELKPRIPSVRTPTLIIQGLLDTVVEPSGASWLYEHLGSKEKAIVRLKTSDHLIALDRERSRAIEETLRFLRADRH
jgi:carboxylesterase